MPQRRSRWRHSHRLDSVNKMQPQMKRHRHNVTKISLKLWEGFIWPNYAASMKEIFMNTGDFLAVLHVLSKVWRPSMINLCGSAQESAFNHSHSVVTKDIGVVSCLIAQECNKDVEHAVWKHRQLTHIPEADGTVFEPDKESKCRKSTTDTPILDLSSSDAATRVNDWEFAYTSCLFILLFGHVVCNNKKEI